MSANFSPFRAVALCTALSVSALIAAPAQAFTDDEARRAILELREQVRQLAEQSRQARIQQADRIEMLQQEVASMRGQLEQLGYKMNSQQGGSAQPAGNAPAPVTDPQEQAAFEGPMSLFKAGKYREAAGSFTQFVQSYPNSQLVPEARFYLGSSRYASKDFKGSIQGLQALLRDTPDDARAPDALLVIAASQVELNDMNGAKASLQRIVKDYPKSPAAETARSRLKLLQ